MVTDEQLIAYLESQLSEEDRREIDLQLTEDKMLRDRLSNLSEFLGLMESSAQFDPPTGIKSEFLSAVESEIRSQPRQLDWPQLAAAVVLLGVGFAVGLMAGSRDDQRLTQELRNLNEMLLASQLKDHSSSTRLQVVNSISELQTQPSEDLLQALIKTSNTDKNANVRYKAIQALREFVHIEEVRRALVRSLNQQEDALVQMAIIELLVEAEEQSAIAPLKRLMEDENTDPGVKKQAAIAVEVLI